MTLNIFDNINPDNRRKIENYIEDEENKRFKNNHPKKTEAQLVQLMHEKGILFNITDREKAKVRLRESTYYFKLGSYRHNFDKNAKGKYKYLEFAYLEDLSILDMRFRNIVLSASLNLEHSLKTLINYIISKDKNEDGYDIVKDFLNEKNFDLDGLYRLYSKQNHYLHNLKSKHSDCTSIWVLLEIITFGGLSQFVEFYFDGDRPFKMRLKHAAALIKFAKNVRNAAAHNNPIILNMRKVSLISPDQKIMRVNNEIGLQSKIYRNPKINDILSLFYLCDIYCSKGIKSHLLEELEAFRDRCEKNADYYKKNQHLLDLFESLNLMIDYYQNRW
ncbi:MAG: Abi family protein [Streptococcaceae bacterium]|jgi:hypothetical protein|nr:Abi family protein [Streptococcaceae bacterium]